MKIGDKFYVSDWREQYTSFYRWVNGVKQSIWDWKSKVPDYSSTDFHWKFVYEPNLTLKGTVNKREPKKLVKKIPVFKNYEYELVEFKNNDRNDEYKDIICLLKSNEGCWIQIGNKGLSTLTLEDQEKVKHLEQEKRLQALAKDNLGKWTINVKKDEFPRELIKYLYDTDQRTCFGSSSPNTKAIIRYPYIPKEYTINGNDICLGWEQDFNGIGCDLSDKEVISWNELPKRFPENRFGS